VSEYRDEHVDPFEPNPDGWTVGISIGRGRHAGEEDVEHSFDVNVPGTGKHRKPVRSPWYPNSAPRPRWW
jgi:hypothetical protein